MKTKLVEQLPDFDPQFPELFNGKRVDQVALSGAAFTIATETTIDLETQERLLVPLRHALRILAEFGRIVEHE